VTVVNHIDHCAHPIIAIIAHMAWFWRRVAALFARVAIPAIDGFDHSSFCSVHEC
jgi:hypothetical protein